MLLKAFSCTAHRRSQIRPSLSIARIPRSAITYRPKHRLSYDDDIDAIIFDTHVVHSRRRRAWHYYFVTPGVMREI